MKHKIKTIFNMHKKTGNIIRSTKEHIPIYTKYFVLTVIDHMLAIQIEKLQKKELTISKQ